MPMCVGTGGFPYRDSSGGLGSDVQVIGEVTCFDLGDKPVREEFILQPCGLWKTDKVQGCCKKLQLCTITISCSDTMKLHVCVRVCVAQEYLGSRLAAAVCHQNRPGLQ